MLKRLTDKDYHKPGQSKQNPSPNYQNVYDGTYGKVKFIKTSDEDAEDQIKMIGFDKEADIIDVTEIELTKKIKVTIIPGSVTSIFEENTLSESDRFQDVMYLITNYTRMTSESKLAHTN